MPIIVPAPKTRLDQVPRAEAEASHRLQEGEVSGEPFRQGLGPGRMAKPAEALGELAGVDRDRAGGGAEAVHGAGVQRHVREVGLQRRQQVVCGRVAPVSVAVPVAPQSHHLPPDHDPLARAEREVEARALRLAVAALDALVNFFFHRGEGLEVGEVRLGIRVDDHPGVEQSLRVHQALQPPHDGGGLGAPLGLQEGGDVPAGAVLPLEGAAVPLRHQADHVVHEAGVAIHLGLRVERLGDGEMQVSVLGVAEDDRLFVAVAERRPDQLHRAVGQRLDGEDHVLDDHRGSPLRARPPRRGRAPDGSSRAAPARPDRG